MPAVPCPSPAHPRALARAKHSLCKCAPSPLPCLQISVAVCVFVFDLLHWNGEALLGHTLRQRRALLPVALPGMAPGRVMLATAVEMVPAGCGGSAAAAARPPTSPPAAARAGRGRRTAPAASAAVKGELEDSGGSDVETDALALGRLLVLPAPGEPGGRATAPPAVVAPAAAAAAARSRLDHASVGGAAGHGGSGSGGAGGAAAGGLELQPSVAPAEDSGGALGPGPAPAVGMGAEEAVYEQLLLSLNAGAEGPCLGGAGGGAREGGGVPHGRSLHHATVSHAEGVRTPAVDSGRPALMTPPPRPPPPQLAPRTARPSSHCPPHPPHLAPPAHTGLMLKRLDAGSGYEPSRRSEAWTKLKRDYCEGLRDSVDVVPIGAWHGQGRKVGQGRRPASRCCSVECKSPGHRRPA